MLQIFLVRFYALDALQALCILLRCALEKTIHRRRRVFSQSRVAGELAFGSFSQAWSCCGSIFVSLGLGVWVKEHITFDSTMCSAVSVSVEWLW